MGRALVFAHFDPHGMVDDYVVHALAVYRQHFEVIHFVSTAALRQDQVARAAALADKVIVRSNVGYDFLSWRVGFESLPDRRFDAVVFANDSCYGPCTDMHAFWQRIHEVGADLWGASMNHQFRPHVQSFFMGFGPRLLASGFARRFWRGVEVIPDKMALIFAYEVGLSARVEEAGFRIGAAVSFPVLDPALKARVIADNASDTDPQRAAEAIAYIEAEDHLNPMQLCWGEALRQGLPFVKVEVLRDNPRGANLRNLFETLRASTWYDTQLIARHLERTARSGGVPLPAQSNAPMRRRAVAA